MIKVIKVNLFYTFSFYLLLSFNQSFGMLQDTLTINAAKSKLTGKILSPSNSNKDSITINITVPHPISGENVQYKTFLDQSGKFSIDVEVETNITMIGLYTSINPYSPIFVKLVSGKITNIDIEFNSEDSIEKIHTSPIMNKYDMTRGLEVMSKMIAYRPDRAPKSYYDKSTDEFLSHAKSSLSERLEIVNGDTLISKELKGLLSKDYRLILYNSFVFDYEREMKRNYSNTNDDRSKTLNIKKIDRSYYKFLLDFNLNDPKYLLGYTFPEFQKKILQNEILGIPLIGDTSIPSWLIRVKSILSDLIGFNSGQYYDILVANAYARQLNEETKPLTENQKKNIINYWGNGEITKILFRKNQQVVEIDKLKSPTVIYNISSVPDDKVMETILSKYKGKVVFIDFWATWCGPCLDAMQQFKDVKGNFQHKNVAFVYLTNRSSPKKLWEEKIIGIGSEHYYLKDSQWEYIMNEFGFSGIPSYLVYDKGGILINKFTGFPGNEKVKEMLEGLL